MFCHYQTRSTGMCGRRCDGDRCDVHKGLVEKPKIEKIPKYRGYSKWGKENGLFVKTVEKSGEK